MNNCGECKACCTVLGVRSLRKDDYSQCRYVCPNGCGIYGERPQECRGYQCYWLAHHGTPDVRPDRVGIILEPTETTIGKAIVVREVSLETWEGTTAQMWAFSVARKYGAFIYLVRPDNTRKAIFPTWVADLAPLAQKIIRYRSWREVEAEEQAKAAAAAAALAKRQQLTAEALARREARRREAQAERVPVVVLKQRAARALKRREKLKKKQAAKARKRNR